MTDIKKEDIKQEVFDLYDDYAHSRISRRDFMQKLSTYAVGSLTVASLMSFLMPDYAGTLQVKQGDPRLKSEYITYESLKAAANS
jgi:carboxymethylenebutenolidase